MRSVSHFYLLAAKCLAFEQVNTSSRLPPLSGAEKLELKT